MTIGAMRVYIVVPCYCEEEALPAANAVLTALLDRIAATGRIDAQSRVLYVDDGSTDATWTLIEGYAATRPERVAGMKLAANSGHQNALLAGLEMAAEQADVMVTIDTDLQDDVEAIATMLDHYEAGCDIVYGVRRRRSSDSWFKRVTALGFYRLMRWLGVKNMVYNHADFRLMSRRAVMQLLSYRERNLFLRGIVPQLGYRTASVYYDRSERTAGRSKYRLGRMCSLAADGITSFSIRPVRLVLALGLVFMVVAVGILAYSLWRYFTGNTVSGWTSLMLSLWFIGGCVLVALGIVGEYIGKIYLEVKDRPRYNIEKTT